jgi:transcriptional regulator with XRE-family HTH domain|tara:strand:+ start:8015 stop:8317 length:303 start_codon:yes stop_codon:yes gene_type:complete
MFSERYLRDLYSFNDKRLGVQFGLLCVKANLPPGEVAKVLGVSRMTLYNWFRGNAVRSKNIERIEELMDIINSNLSLNSLPVQSHKEAKQFIKSNVIGKL